MKVTKHLLLAAIVLPLVLSACRGQLSEQEPIHPNMNMDQQKRFDAQEKNEFFDDNRAMRKPVEGTIARGNLRDDPALYQGINEDSSFVNEIPVDVTKSFIYRGKDRFEVFCTPCHGLTGNGEGIIMVNNYGYVPAPSFHIERLRNRNDGYFYSVITNGVRTMPSYASQIPVEDRWAIVSYIRALQRSQHVPKEEVEQYDVDIATLQKEYQEEQQAAQAREEAAAKGGNEEVSAERGETIAQDNGCMTCHSTDGTKLVGPTWQNVYGHEVTLEDGSTVTADEEYLRESIVDPNAKIVEGYPPSMTPYDYLSDSEISSLIEYIKSLSDAE